MNASDATRSSCGGSSATASTACQSRARRRRRAPRPYRLAQVAALVADRILAMHGGLSPELASLDQIARIERPTEVPEGGLLCDLLWSDPDPAIMGWGAPPRGHCRPAPRRSRSMRTCFGVRAGYNTRGVSYTFGHEVIRDFLKQHDLDIVCRAHQVVEDGYEFQAARGLVTIFSAPNYCGEFDNAGGMMCVDTSLCCSFKVLRPMNTKKNHEDVSGVDRTQTLVRPDSDSDRT